MATTSTRTALSSVDDHLGPADQRFFGRGFRRVGYDIGDVRIAAAEDGGLRSGATVGVRYPVDWSKKAASGDLRPHFSTIDALVVAAQLTEVCLAGSADGGADLTTAWLRRVRIGAGGKPQEDLEGLAASAVRRGVGPVEDAAGEPAPGLSASVFDCAIGAMRVQCEVVHPSLRPVPGERRFAHPDDLLGPAADRYFGTGFTARRQHVRDVEVDQAGLGATARLTLAPDGPQPRTPAGIAAAHQPSVSMVDAFVTALQLAQVMLYEHDGVRRQDSNTLWMRQTVMSAGHPERIGADGVPVTTRLAALDLLRMRGATWRTLDVLGEMAGIRLKSSVTHQLPEGHRLVPHTSAH
ncbi:AvrD family protein [Streptomyces sp. NBC_00442]|uniref:AvrD family protein n=1 Tax=Streptomyces sp. NBC_00442 TaxID=2903651 RepID=UPI002E1C418B